MGLKDIIMKCANEDYATIKFANVGNEDIQITYEKPDAGIKIYNGWDDRMIIETDDDFDLEELVTAIECFKDLKKALRG